MPGGRLAVPKIGDSNELLAEFVIGRMAFTTRVPRQEDVGHDLICSVFEKSGHMLHVGPSFTVQVKSNRDPLVFSKDYEVEWIRNQENPFFLCVVNRGDLSVELYATWNMLNAFLKRTVPTVILKPGSSSDQFEDPIFNEAEKTHTIPLGKPILNVKANDIMDDEKADQYSAVLKQWIKIDRENIINKNAGLYWVQGPTEWTTNEPLVNGEKPILTCFWSGSNLPKSRLIFGRAATALRLSIRSGLGEQGEKQADIVGQIQDLERVLKSHKMYLEDLSKTTLKKEVGLDVAG